MHFCIQRALTRMLITTGLTKRFLHFLALFWSIVPNIKFLNCILVTVAFGTLHKCTILTYLLVENIGHCLLAVRGDYNNSFEPRLPKTAGRRGRVLVSIIEQIKSSASWQVSSEDSCCSNVPWAMRAPLMVFDWLLANSSDVDQRRFADRRTPDEDESKLRTTRAMTRRPRSQYRCQLRQHESDVFAVLTEAERSQPSKTNDADDEITSTTNDAQLNWQHLFFHTSLMIIAHRVYTDIISQLQFTSHSVSSITISIILPVTAAQMT